MADFKQIMISVLLVGLFIIALTNGVQQLSNDNNVTNELSNNTAYASMSSDIEEDLESSEEVATSFRKNFESENDNIFKTSFLFLGSVLKGAQTTISLFINVLTAPLLLFQEGALGVSPLVLTIFTALIVLTLVLMAWRLIKTGT